LMTQEIGLIATRIITPHQTNEKRFTG
jgi:hypothetical protein